MNEEKVQGLVLFAAAESRTSNGEDVLLGLLMAGAMIAEAIEEQTEALKRPWKETPR